MEDGKGCVVLRGLEEEAVYSRNEIYNLLEKGAAKRRTEDTLLSKRRSSHSVFTITVHIKEATVGDEEIIKYGMLNLVDLVGSKNISRSGAREKFVWLKEQRSYGPILLNASEYISVLFSKRVSVVAKEGFNEYAEQLKSHFVEATLASAEIKATTENCLAS
ncbi:hypothetical protein LguiA_025616 [Lonicera macranthoides]